MRISDWSSDVCSSDLPCTNMSSGDEGRHTSFAVDPHPGRRLHHGAYPIAFNNLPLKPFEVFIQVASRHLAYSAGRRLQRHASARNIPVLVAGIDLPIGFQDLVQKPYDGRSARGSRHSSTSDERGAFR